ncbi:unnamed protein product, partial [Tetraodon nigroviridis]
PLLSLPIMFIAFILNVWTILAFVSGIFFILSGLALVVGLVLGISRISQEVLNRTRSGEAFLTCKYGWSFAFAALCFLLTEVR